MGKTNDTSVTNILLSVNDAAKAIGISTKTLRMFIRSGRIKSINLGMRMTRISLEELQGLAEANGYQVIFKDAQTATPLSKPETGHVNKTAKCRKTPKAGEIAPEGVTHDTHYTMGEVLSKFAIKYGRFYEVRNRYQLKSVHAWGTTCFRKEDVEDAIARYNEEQGRAQREAYYTCFDIMQKFGLGKTQVRRFAETHGVRIKKAKGGRANLYLKADWDAARKKAEAKRKYTKAQREGL